MQTPTPREHFGLALTSLRAEIDAAKSRELLHEAAKRREVQESAALRLKAPQNPLTHGFIVDKKVRSAAFDANLHQVISDIEYLQNGLASIATRLFNSGLAIELSPLCNTVTITGSYVYALKNLLPPAARKQEAM